MRFSFFLFLFLTSSLLGKSGYYEPWGRDGSLALHSKEEVLKHEKGLFVSAARKAILFHQNVISPVDGPRSHFRPTSSRFMLIAMERNGFIKGFIMGCDRLLRENSEPWVYRTREIDGEIYKWDPTFE